MNEAALQALILNELGRSGPVEQYQTGFWRGAASLEIRREAPVATRAGKILPFQLLEYPLAETPT